MSTLNREIFELVRNNEETDLSPIDLFDHFTADYKSMDETSPEGLCLSCLRNNIVTMIDDRDDSAIGNMVRFIKDTNTTKIPIVNKNIVIIFIKMLMTNYMENCLNSNEFDNNFSNTSAVEELFNDYINYDSKDYSLLMSWLVDHGYMSEHSVSRYLTSQNLLIRSSFRNLMKRECVGKPCQTEPACAKKTTLIDNLNTGMDFNKIMSLNGKVIEGDLEGVTLTDFLQLFTINTDISQSIGSGKFDECAKNIYFEKIMIDNLNRILTEVDSTVEQIENFMKTIISLDPSDPNNDILQDRMVLSILTVLNYIVALNDVNESGSVSDDTERLAKLFLQLYDASEQSGKLLLPSDNTYIAEFCKRMCSLTGHTPSAPKELGLSSPSVQYIYERMSNDAVKRNESKDVNESIEIERNRMKTEDVKYPELTNHLLDEKVFSLTEGF